MKLYEMVNAFNDRPPGAAWNTGTANADAVRQAVYIYEHGMVDLAILPESARAGIGLVLRLVHMYGLPDDLAELYEPPRCPPYDFDVDDVDEQLREGLRDV